MTLSQQKLKKLKELLQMIDESLTRKEFTENFGKILEFLKKLKEGNKEEFASFNKTSLDLSEKLKESNTTNFAGLKNQFISLIDKALREQENGMNFIKDKVKRIKSGKDGKDADETKIVKKVLAQMPEQKETILDTPEQIADKLEVLKGKDKLKIKAIKNLEKRLKELEKRPIGRSGGGARKITYIKRENLSSQCDGSTKTFTLPKDTIDVIGVFGTQFPINFDPGTDWTFSGRTLTLTSEVSAPNTGQTLYALIECLFYG